LGLGLSGFAAWFQLPGWGWLILPMAYLAWAWFKPTERSILHLVTAPAVYWLAIVAGLFPNLGVCAIPADIEEKAKIEAVAFYDGPQPAMLAILSKLSMPSVSCKPLARNLLNSETTIVT
jgi:hypothetical protein